MSQTLRDLVSAWQSSFHTPSDDELAAQIRTIEAVLLENQRLGYEIHSHLARYPEQAHESRAILEEFHREQATLMTRLGELMLEWRRRGGNFDLRKRGEPRVPPRPVKAEATKGEDGDDEETPETLNPSSTPQEMPVSAEALRAWKEQLQKKQVPVSRPAEMSEAKQRAVLLSLMNTLGEIRELNSMVNIVDEVDGLEKITSPEYRTQWALMSKPMQRVWLAMLVARTRNVKDATTTNPGLRERIKAFILHFPAYAKTYQPGYVNGLQVSHNPEHGSWYNDAIIFWNQLKQMTVAPLPSGEEEPGPIPPPPVAPPSSSVVPAATVPNEDDGPAIDSHWPLWSLVRDKRGILLGGEPREPARIKLENAFAMAELEWIPGDNPRRVDSVVERVTQNRVDIVFVLQQWTAHKVTNKLIDACKSSGVPWALVSSYSIKSIRAGLDRFLSAAREATSS
ncbi:MAG: hypothetical protein RMJ98_04230 [Myxococcales bacterium]|nr:hypothetical protein [Polyangiaceae bacterium]MDW8248498.1 hypothetical protein [Myxococcales bacterium]